MLGLCSTVLDPQLPCGSVPLVGLGGGEHRAVSGRPGPCGKALPWAWRRPAAPQEQQCWGFFIPTPRPPHGTRSRALSPHKPSPLRSPLSFPLNRHSRLFGVNQRLLSLSSLSLRGGAEQGCRNPCSQGSWSSAIAESLFVPQQPDPLPCAVGKASWLVTLLRSLGCHNFHFCLD